MKVFFMVAGALLIVMCLLITIINPLGLLGVAFGVLLIIYGKKYKKPAVETKAETNAPIQPTIGQVTPESAADGFKRETIKVAGISQYTDNVLSLGTENPEYFYSKREIIDNSLEDEDIPEYTFRKLPATFEFEPDNEYDSNAIAVYVTGLKIGYVKQGTTAHIRKLIEGDKIESASCEIVGGKMKRLDSDDNSLEKKDLNYGARITLKVKP